VLVQLVRVDPGQHRTLGQQAGDPFQVQAVGGAAGPHEMRNVEPARGEESGQLEVVPEHDVGLELLGDVEQRLGQFDPERGAGGPDEQQRRVIGQRVGSRQSLAPGPQMILGEVVDVGEERDRVHRFPGQPGGDPRVGGDQHLMTRAGEGAEHREHGAQVGRGAGDRAQDPEDASATRLLGRRSVQLVSM
jgi:hypothetical protein